MSNKGLNVDGELGSFEPCNWFVCILPRSCEFFTDKGFDLSFKLTVSDYHSATALPKTFEISLSGSELLVNGSLAIDPWYYPDLDKERCYIPITTQRFE